MQELLSPFLSLIGSRNMEERGESRKRVPAELQESDNRLGGIEF